MQAKQPHPRIVGYEIMRRVQRSEFPDHPVDLHTTRAVLGAEDRQFLLPPGVDLFELGLIELPGLYELLPIDTGGKPLWNDVVHLLITKTQAKRQRALLRRAYRALHAMIQEADKLEASVADWSRRGEEHPIFGMLRLEAIEVWAAMRQDSGPLGEHELDALHAEVARRVATKIGAHLLG